LKILYASEEEKVTINENGQLTISGSGIAHDDVMDDDNKNNDEDESLV